MRTLILSCNTGEGHNSCARAIQEEFQRRGAVCEMDDALRFISPRASRLISNWHVRIYRHIPFAFRFGYHFAEQHPHMFSRHTFVYRFLTSGTQRLSQHIRQGGYDVVICPHAFSALMATRLRQLHPAPLHTCFVATDYTCSPSCDKSDLDFYFIPSDTLAEEFAQKGVAPDRLMASGIPVRRMFYRHMDPARAKADAGVDPAHRHLLVMCGSMGCGPIETLAARFARQLTPEQEVTIVCGTNEKLHRRLEHKFGACPRLHIQGYAEDISALMDSADLYLTKPGGISVTEAAVKGLPMVFVNAVAGCEQYNMDFFLQTGAAATAKTPEALAALCLTLLASPERLEQMRRALEQLPRHAAAEQIYTTLS